VRIKLEYPPPNIEMEIVKYHVNVNSSQEKELGHAFKLANSLRDAAALEELYYGPSIRESIAFAKLIREGMPIKQAAEVVYANVYEQWGEVEYRKVMDMITSIFG
jgi:nitric oxide reductase NorQ protein